VIAVSGAAALLRKSGDRGWLWIHWACYASVEELYGLRIA